MAESPLEYAKRLEREGAPAASNEMALPVNAPNPETQSPLEYAKSLEYQGQDGGLMHYEDASTGEKGLELARSVGRGGEYAFEFLGDIADIGRASVDQFIPGMEDWDLWDTANPFAPPDRGDLSREWVYEKPWAQALTEEKISREGAPALFNAGKTFSEYVIPTVTGGGAGTLRQAGKQVLATGVPAAGAEYLGGLWSEDAGEYAEAAASMIGPFSVSALSNYLRKRYGGNPNVGDRDYQDAADIITEFADDKELAMKNFEAAMARGEKGTLAELTGDAGIYNIEDTVRSGSAGARQMSSLSSQRNQQLQEGVRDTFGNAPIDISQDVAGQRLQETLNAINQRTQAGIQGAEDVASGGLQQSLQRLSHAQENLDEASAGLEVTDALNTRPMLLSEASRDLSRQYDQYEQLIRKFNVSPAWDEFDNLPPIHSGYIPQAIDGVLDDMTGTTRRGFERAFADELAELRELPENVSPKEIHGVISGIKNKLNAVEDARPYHQEAAKFNKALEDFLENSEAGKAYIKARNETRDLHSKVNPDYVGEARKGYDESFATDFPLKGPAGRRSAQNIKAANNPEIEQRAVNMMLALAAKEGVDPAFMSNYEDFLSEFPNLRRQFQDIVDQQSEVGKAESALKLATAQEDTVQQGLTATRQAQEEAFTGRGETARRRALDTTLRAYDQNPTQTIDNALNDIVGGHSPDTFRSLANSFGRDAEGMTSFRSAVGERLVRRMKNNKGEINPESLSDYEALRPILEDTGVLNADELAVVDAYLNRTSSITARGQASKHGLDVKSSADMFPSLAAAGALNVIPGNSLVLAGAVRRAFKDMMIKENNPQIHKAIEDIVSNPEKFHDLMKRSTGITPTTMEQKVKAFVLDMARLGTGQSMPGVIVGSGDDERILQGYE